MTTVPASLSCHACFRRSKAIQKNPSPKGIIETLDLRKPIYRKTASYGHFGREDQGFKWELTNKANELKKICG